MKSLTQTRLRLSDALDELEESRAVGVVMQRTLAQKEDELTKYVSKYHKYKHECEKYKMIKW